MSAILVTGAAGFIGSHVVDLLVERGHKVVGLDNLDPQVHAGKSWPSWINPGARYLLGDVRDEKHVRLGLDRCDTVIHLAATVGVGQSMTSPAYYGDTNCLGTCVLLEEMGRRRDQYKRLVVASSMSLYGEGATGIGGPIQTSEWSTPNIVSVYAASKKFQEDACMAWGAAFGVPTLALRFFNTWGPRQSLGNPYTGVVAIFLGALLRGERPIIFGDGEQTRDFVNVNDVARAVVMAAEKSDVSGVLNVGTGKRTSILRVSHALAAAVGRPDLEPTFRGHRAGDIRHCFADPSAARRVLWWEATVPFEAASLGPLIEWTRANAAQATGAMTTQAEAVRELELAGLVRP